MHIRKYDHDFSRRFFLEQTAKGIATAGVLGPLWPMIGNSADITKAYPDELLSVDAWSKGKVKTGDFVTAENVDIVKDLLDPVAYMQIKKMGRKIKIVPTTRDVTRMYPYEHLEATLRNQGKAKLNADGNIVTLDGKPWIGGNPFPDAKTGAEVAANLTLSWGRHDNSLYCMRDQEVAPDGSLSYQYDFVWIEQNTQSRVDGKVFPGAEDKLRFNTVLFTAPSDSRGTSYLSTWYYDQRKFPELVGYLPAFKRVRKFPTNQRFEPIAAGINFYLSDAWASGDPMLTWGNYKIVGRGPLLGGVSQTWYGDHPNWERPVHGGPKGLTFYDANMELCPDVVIFEAEPVGFPRAPVSKKRVWVDVRNMMFIAYATYDRRGELFKSLETHFSLYEKGDKKLMDGKHTAWSWTACMFHNVQDGRMTRFEQAKSITGGFTQGYNVEGFYEKYLTEQALQRLGT
ncbi:hypothetical protein Y694_03980 [Methylibium sp. T29-B]|uniref:DUF1329 domain-containing protein n=2 Tax=unclassified Methylibium TaxID=2633235 RepID=UPI0003F41EE7|nr:DUF1329 domain-containing protein [Methylibium sp. T29-B]EWS58110.1 hypothetical protein Y694_03980 [Methylibium sp. T29-B]